MRTNPTNVALLAGLLAMSALASPAWAVMHPTLGRWTQRDPAGCADGMNLLAAYHVMWGKWDPLGLVIHVTGGGRGLVNGLDGEVLTGTSSLRYEGMRCCREKTMRWIAEGYSSYGDCVDGYDCTSAEDRKRPVP